MKRLMLHIITVLSLACLLMAASCSSLRNQDPTLNLAINIGVMKAIEAVPQDERVARAERIVNLANIALDMLDDQDAVIGAVYERVLSEIKWADMDISDQLILRQLIAHVAAAVEERIQNKTLDGEKITAVKTAVEWVKQSAETYAEILQGS